MKEKTNELLKQVQVIMDDDSDFLIITHKDDQYGIIAQGEAENIAKSIFSCMHKPNNPMGQILYNIIKLNVMNILSNLSIFKQDLIDTIYLRLPENEQ